MQNQIEEILSGGYEPPIKTVIGEAKTEIDNDVCKAVCQIGIRVDKEELLRALQYDRGQYDKGFADGVRKGQQGWISVEDDLPKNDYDKHWKDRKRYLVFTEPSGIMFVATYGYKEHDWWVNGDHFVLEKRNYREVTHWMPMPKPPKGE